MPRHTPPPPPAVEDHREPVVSTSRDIALPAPRARRDVDVGVQRVRRTTEHEARQDAKRTMGAEEAGQLSTRFPKGGRAFAKFVLRQNEDPKIGRTAEAWEPLLTEFASRPVHGHRRGQNGGNHRRKG